MTPADYPLGARVVLIDVERVVQKPNAGEPGVRRGVINGEAFEQDFDTGPIVYVPVYVPDGDLCLYVDARNVLEVNP